MYATFAYELDYRHRQQGSEETFCIIYYLYVKGSAFCGSCSFRPVTKLGKKSFKVYATFAYELDHRHRQQGSEETFLLERNDLTAFQRGFFSYYHVQIHW